MIELFSPYVTKEMIDEVVDTLHSRWIGQGPKVDLFEKEFESLFSVKYAVMLNSGTSALETAYDLIGLKEGDTVISTPLTCTATNLPLLAKKVKIVWADVLEKTLCIDPIDVHKKITGKTKAVVQVHLGGIEANVGKLHVPVISDACQALGIFVGDYTCNSFQAIKSLTTGDGGMLVLNNAEEYRRARLMRWFGIDRERKIKNEWQCYKERKMTFDIEMIGYKRQPTDIAAALGLAGLKKYNFILEHRRRLFSIYKDRLKDIDGIRVVDGQQNVYWLMTVLVKRRDDFCKMLFENHVDTNMVQLRNDIYKIFGGKRADLPTLNRIESEYVSLPIGMHVSIEEVQYICDYIKAGW